MKKFVAVVMVLMLITPLFPAFADGTWYCPKCGQQNSDNFCPKDGTPRPTNTSGDIGSTMNYTNYSHIQCTLNNQLATRTGPSTRYDEPGTFLSAGKYVTALSKVYDQNSEIWWIQVEFSESGKLYWAYTGLKRLNGLNLANVPEEDVIGNCTTTSSTVGYYAPSAKAATIRQSIPAGIECTIYGYVHSDADDYVQIEFYDSGLRTYRRAWVKDETVIRDRYSAQNDEGDEYGYTSSDNLDWLNDDASQNDGSSNTSSDNLDWLNDYNAQDGNEDNAGYASSDDLSWLDSSSDALDSSFASEVDGIETIKNEKSILGVVVYKNWGFTEEDVIALCEECGLSLSDFDGYEWVTDDTELDCVNEALELYGRGCSTIIFAGNEADVIEDGFQYFNPWNKAVTYIVMKDDDAQNQEEDASTNDIDWQIYFIETTAGGGYQIKITLKFSPFALVSKNLDYLERAWDEIESSYSAKNSLPTNLQSWDDFYKYGITDWHDMYFSVGEVKIENITPGWDITETSPVLINFKIWGDVRCKVYFGNKTEKSLSLYTTLKGNVFSFPVVLCQFERFTPNRPNGQEREKLESKEFKVEFQGFPMLYFSIPVL